MTEPVLQRGSAAIPEAEHRHPPTPTDQLDDALATLQAHADEWVRLDLAERIDLLERLREGTLAVAERWVATACEAKGIEPGSPAVAEEWLGGPATTVRNLTLLLRTLRDIQAHGKPQLPGRATLRANGQVAAPVFPTDRWDALLFSGFTAEVWMDPSVGLDDLQDTMAVFYARPPERGRVALVLGAGNVTSIGPMDALYKLFVEGEVVVLKMNPVIEALGPVLEDAFAALVRRGFLRVVYGGAAEGDYLCTHPSVGSIHITGSDKTHDAIVWGAGDEGRRRKEAGTPRNDKPITSELGNVTPFIVVPGPWSQRQLDWHGMNIASSLVNNAGFNCNATRVVITHAQWPLRDAFLEPIERAFQQVGPRAPYYPGAAERQATFLAAHPHAKLFGPRGDDRVPWTFIRDLDADREDELCFRTEAWCGVMGEVPLSAHDAVAFIERAVEHANEKLWGTLSCSIVVHPDSMRDPRIAAAVDKAIEDLRYGSVVVNHWSALSYGFVSTPWGAYPGHTKADVGSGIGVVHNSYMFDRPQKTVIRGPFTVTPTPAWFASCRTGVELGRKLTWFNAEPTPRRLASLLWSAVRA